MIAHQDPESLARLQESALELQTLEEAGLLSPVEKQRMLDRLWKIHQQDKEAGDIRTLRAKKALEEFSAIGAKQLKSTKG